MPQLRPPIPGWIRGLDVGMSQPMGTVQTVGLPALRSIRRSIGRPTPGMVVILLAGLCGCDSVPGDQVIRPAETKELTLLDDEFVRFEGQRLPIDEFLFLMRQRGRAALANGKPLFGLRILAPEDKPVDQRLLSRIMQDLRLAGVQYVTIG